MRNTNRRPTHRKKRRRPQDNPVFRVLIAALAVMLVVLVCVGMTSLMPKIDPGEQATDQASPKTPKPQSPPPSRNPPSPPHRRFTRRSARSMASAARI